MTIKELNDAYRCHHRGRGKTLITSGVTAKGQEFVDLALGIVCHFEDFTEDNNPYGENDFGFFTLRGEKVLWKIDYYDLSCTYGSEDPANPDVTTRVLTIMLAEEY